MINWQKTLDLMNNRNITTTQLKKIKVSQSLVQKIKMCSGTNEQIIKKLNDYKEKNGKDFQYEISSKSVELLCQLFQVQPNDLIDWNVELDNSLSLSEQLKKYK